MKDMLKTVLFFALIAAAFFIVSTFRSQFFSPCSGSLIPLGAIDGVTQAAIRFKMDPHPALNEVVPVEVEVTPCFTPSGELEAWLELPPSAAFIGGQTAWRGTLGKGQTERFTAPVAFVAEGTSRIYARAAYSSTERASPVLHDVSSVRAFVRVKGDGVWPPPEGTATPAPDATPGPKPFWRIPEFGFEPRKYIVEGSRLINREERPRAFLVYSERGLETLENMGLLVDEPEVRWHSESVGYGGYRGILRDDFPSQGILLALYDGVRPSTGYTFAAARMQQDGVSPPNTLTLDIIASSPSPDWPVENRPVSPYAIDLVYRGQIPHKLVLRVNGAVAGKYTVGQGSEKGVQEMELPSLPKRAIP